MTWAGQRLRRWLRGQEGFSIVELVVVMMLAGIIAIAIFITMGNMTGAFHSQNTRMLNQDNARTAINQVARYVRMATSSADNQTTQTNAVLTAQPRDLEFYVDIDGDGVAEKARYYVSGNTLKMQTVNPQWVTSPMPGYVYPDYDTDGIVIQDAVQNSGASEPVFRYYRLGGPAGDPLVEFTPTTTADKQKVVTIGISLIVNERPDLAKGDVRLATQADIRQRFIGELD